MGNVIAGISGIDDACIALVDEFCTTIQFVYLKTFPVVPNNRAHPTRLIQKVERRRMTKEANHRSSQEDEKRIPGRKLTSLPLRIVVNLISFLISFIITICFLLITGQITGFFL